MYQTGNFVCNPNGKLVIVVKTSFLLDQTFCFTTDLITENDGYKSSELRGCQIEAQSIALITQDRLFEIDGYEGEIILSIEEVKYLKRPYSHVVKLDYYKNNSLEYCIGSTGVNFIHQVQNFCAIHGILL